MIFLPQVLWGPSQLLIAGSNIYSCLVNQTTIINRVSILNTDSGTQKISIYVLRNGAAASSNNILLESVTLLPAQSVTPNELNGLTLNGFGTNAVDKIYMTATKDNVINTIGSGYAN